MRVPWYLMAKGKGGGTKTASGPVAHWTDGVDAPLKSLLVNIDPVQEGAGDPSPDNVRPISGWSAVNVWRTGGNVWDELCELGIINSDGSVAPASNRLVTGYIPVISGETYYLTGEKGRGRAAYYDKDKIFLSYYADFPATNKTFTVPSNAKYLRYCFTVAYGSTYNHDVSFNYLSTDTNYHPYSGNQYTIQLGDTVYGGTLDVTGGKMVVDAELEVFNRLPGDGALMSQINSFSPTSSGVGIIGDYARISFAVRSEIDQSKYNRQSSTYKYKMCNLAKHSFAYNEQSTHWYRNTVLYLFLPTALVGSTAQSVYDYLVSIKDTTPLSLWIPLATPITIPLTPTEISTLKGQNNVWADSGDVTVEYLASGGANPDLMKLAVAFMWRR